MADAKVLDLESIDEDPLHRSALVGSLAPRVFSKNVCYGYRYSSKEETDSNENALIQLVEHLLHLESGPLIEGLCALARACEQPEMKGGDIHNLLLSLQDRTVWVGAEDPFCGLIDEKQRYVRLDRALKDVTPVIMSVYDGLEGTRLKAEARNDLEELKILRRETTNLHELLRLLSSVHSDETEPPLTILDQASESMTATKRVLDAEELNTPEALIFAAEARRLRKMLEKLGKPPETGESSSEAEEKEERSGAQRAPLKRRSEG